MSILPPGPSASAVRDFGSFYGIPSLLVLPQRQTLCPSRSPSPRRFLLVTDHRTGRQAPPRHRARFSYDHLFIRSGMRLPEESLLLPRVQHLCVRHITLPLPLKGTDFSRGSRAAESTSAARAFRRNSTKFFAWLHSPITPVRRFLKNKLSYPMSSRMALHCVLVIPKSC
jgi:hypothetical protein